MSLVLVDGMAAVRTGLAAPVLGLAVVLPVAVSKAVALIGRGAYIAGTGGAILLYLVLRGTVSVVPRSGAVAAVGCRPAAASGTGGRAAVLAAVVVRPAAVAVAVALHQSAAVVAVFVPVAAVPLRVGGVMVTRLHIDIAADRADPVRVKRVRGLRTPVEFYLAAAGAACDVPVQVAAIRLPFPYCTTRISRKADAVAYAAVVTRGESRGNERKGQHEDKKQGYDSLFHFFFLLLHDGDREHDVQRVHVLAVGRVGGDFGEIFERKALLGLYDREGRGVYTELAGAFRDAAVYLERNAMRAREAVVISDLVCAVRDLDAGDANCTVRRVVRNLRVVRGNDRAVNDVNRQRRGNGDVHSAVLVVYGERHGHGGGR